MLGITSINGFYLPMEQRFAKIKAAGFDSILLWWGPEETARGERAALARRHGLRIKNAHADTANLNALWLDGAAGDGTLSELKREIIDCSLFGIDTLVMHLTNGSTPPPISAIGISRIEELICLAERRKIKLAFENVRKPEYTQYVLDHYASSSVGLCYDSGHEYLWTLDFDWLNAYASRILAIHLQDNNSGKDSHFVPFDGQINWSRKAKQLAAASYTGAITLECEFHSSSRYQKAGFDAFLSYAYQNGRRLAEMIQAEG